MKTFGERLKELRIEKDMTGEELGKVFNVSRTAISNWENSNRFPQDEILLKNMADYFNVTLDYLFGRTDNPKAKVYEETLNGNNYSIEVDKSYPYELTPEEVKKMLDQLYEVGFDVNKLVEKAKNQDK